MYANESAVFGRVKSLVDWLIKRRFDWLLIGCLLFFFCSHRILRAREPAVRSRVRVLHADHLSRHVRPLPKVSSLIFGFIQPHLHIENLHGRQYTWIDDRGKKIRLSAPQYIDYVMTYAQRTVSDETIFPTKFAHDFPPTFEQTLRKIQRLLFHVVAHLYHQVRTVRFGVGG
jgi:Mob1/phocein family